MSYAISKELANEMRGVSQEKYIEYSAKINRLKIELNKAKEQFADFCYRKRETDDKFTRWFTEMEMFEKLGIENYYSVSFGGTVGKPEGEALDDSNTCYKKVTDIDEYQETGTLYFKVSRTENEYAVVYYEFDKWQ